MQGGVFHLRFSLCQACRDLLDLDCVDARQDLAHLGQATAAKRMTAPTPTRDSANAREERPLWGHEERFPPTRRSAGSGFRKETLAGTHRNGRDPPITVVAETGANPSGTTLSWALSLLE